MLLNLIKAFPTILAHEQHKDDRCTALLLPVLLKCYSQILCGGSAENCIVEFAYFALILWQTDNKQEILKQSCKDLFIWTELPII